MKISWVVLTFNRAVIVDKAMTHNFEICGRKPDELIWVDNGSRDGVRDVMKNFNPDVAILNRENLGVAKGYNRGIVLATGDWVVITGCDMLMPKNWLATFAEYVEKIPNTGVACMYSVTPDKVPERIRGEKNVINGLPIIPAIPIERRIFRRELIQKAGHLREDFGLYGYEDCEAAFRYERVCKENGWLTYVIPDQIAEHLGTEGISDFNGLDSKDYHEFKRRECRNPAKEEKFRWCNENKFPYYTPYV